MTTVVEGLDQLRAPFPDKAVGKLPKVTCRSCSAKDTNCTEHRKAKCNACGAFISSAHIHIDYVGHAEVTDRLLTVDPNWSWEPMAFGADGLPALVRNERGTPVGMWIRLTVLGVTRPGYGSSEPKVEAVKELIGDAIRNAAMRFGVALDLWSKTELESLLAEATTDTAATADTPPAAANGSRGRNAVAKARQAVSRSPEHDPPLPDEEPMPPPPAQRPAPAERSGEGTAAPADTGVANPDGPSPAQTRMLFALLNGSGLSSDDDRHEYATSLLGRPVTSFTELSKSDASKLIDDLRRLSTAGAAK